MCGMWDWTHPAEHVERSLSEWLRERLRAYADGANPLSSVRWHIIPATAAQRYLVTRPDRSRVADDTRVDV